MTISGLVRRNSSMMASAKMGDAAQMVGLRVPRFSTDRPGLPSGGMSAMRAKSEQASA